MQNIFDSNMNRPEGKSLPAAERVDGKLEILREAVEQAHPYLGITGECVFFNKELFKVAETIHGRLYGNIGDNCDLRIITTHRVRVDREIWEPLLGRTLLSAIREHFQSRGIHCHTPEKLSFESNFFATSMMNGNIDRFTQFLMWSLIKDPQIVDKLLRQGRMIFQNVGDTTLPTS